MSFQHVPVMPEEVCRFLAPKTGGCYVDGTLGGGGHTELILAASSPAGRVIAFDRDREALTAAAERLKEYGERLYLIHGNFADMADELARIGVSAIDGFLLDLGVSSHQLDTPGRGFSFQQDAPLDMRMDQKSGDTAADLVNEMSEGELLRIIREYGEERFARRIAAAVVRVREEKPVTTTLQLAEIVRGAIPRRLQEERIHPATRTFQALRIALNEELASLDRGLRSGIKLLKPGGRGVVISFHSLEDRMVKTIFRESASRCTCPKDLPRCVCNVRPAVRVLTTKPVIAGEDEEQNNPRSRSAKLRAVEKMDQQAEEAV